MIFEARFEFNDTHLLEAIQYYTFAPHTGKFSDFEQGQTNFDIKIVYNYENNFIVTSLHN